MFNEMHFLEAVSFIVVEEFSSFFMQYDTLQENL